MSFFVALLSKFWTRRLHTRSLEDSSMTTSEQAEQTVQKILSLHQKFKVRQQLPGGLKPCEEVNGLFEDLVRICTTCVGREITEKVMGDKRITEGILDLRTACAEGEAMLEAHWVDFILREGRHGEVFKLLKSFPYYQNYLDLTRIELAAIYASSSPSVPSLEKIAFIGSGPLPLSSLCLLDALSGPEWPLGLPSILSQHLETEPKHRTGDTIPEKRDPKPKGLSVLNIDHDQKAITSSKAMCKELGLRAEGMKFLCTEAEGDDYEMFDCDVVFIAALVGESQNEKEKMVERVASKMRKNALMLIRSGERERALLYPEFDPTTERVRSVLDICVVLHPYNHVVNSVIVGRVVGGCKVGSDG